MRLKVLDPTYQEDAATRQMAPGLPSLEGLTVGLLDNGKRNVARFLDHAEELLRAHYGVRAFVRQRKADPTRPAPPEVLAAFRACDAVISAVGD